MGYLSCNGRSSIAACDPYNWDCTPRKPRAGSGAVVDIRDFPYCDLQSATNGFSQDNFLGKGSHGSVYKAVIDDGKLVAAVKKTTSSEGNKIANAPVENEIEILSRVRNGRLVNLLGFGTDSAGEGKLIVVEYMANGSLYDKLHGSDGVPGWSRRVRFSLQVAKAVHYLHSSNPPVIHRDIKSSNVLIDGNYDARLGDFGLALRGHVEDVRVKCTPPAGTLGYLDPAYLLPGDLSTKSDVFSFGILLLEIISGRNAIDVKYSPPSVVDWALPLIKSGDYSGICDPRIGPPVDTVVMRQLALVATWCVRPTATKRPTMSEVVECLKSVHKRVKSSRRIWNDIGRRVVRARESSRVIRYETLDDSTEVIKTSRTGSRRNRKVSSVMSAEPENDPAAVSSSDRVARSKSIGSVSEIKQETLDSITNRRRAGLGVKLPTVRLNRSKSTGMLQGSKLGKSNNSGVVLKISRNSSGNEKEESKLLVNV